MPKFTIDGKSEAECRFMLTTIGSGEFDAGVRLHYFDGKYRTIILSVRGTTIGGRQAPADEEK